ncbi:MAG: PASTA domain-containing protein [Candidatus Eisenbacteria bacterium]|nr:PASTA domain-containing protein [Candidatus Eisenbacteria bacterium]MCC7144102.1 PASTA domain-containing protein [Candidatus Eisenbacteria bacterium]
MGRGARLRILTAALAAVWVVLVLRAAQLQIVQHSYWLDRASALRSDTLSVPAPRGAILSSDGVILARSVPNRSLGVDPFMVRDPEALASALDSLGLVEPRAFLRKLAAERARDSHFFWVSRQVLPETQLESVLRRHRGLSTITESKRLYPLGWSGAPVVGMVGHENQPIMGLEASFDADLKGEEGRMTQVKSLVGDAFPDVDSPVLETRVVREPRLGRSLVSTIDSRMQEIAMARLQAGVERTGARGGFVIVTRPRTGEILALASSPSVDPDSSGSWTEDARRARAYGDAFEPGSSYKMVAFAAALEAGVLRPEQLIDCMNGRRSVAGGGMITDHDPYGVLTATEVLAHSSNIGTGLIAERAGAERFYRMEKAFGFGLPSELQLKGEGRGRIPEPSAWSARSLITQAFGQEVSATGIQLAMAYGAVANGGLLMRPLLVSEVRENDGATARRHEPEAIRRVISESTARALREMLRAVVTDGTARKAEIENFPPAGKTSTAQKYIPEEKSYSTRRYMAGFIGFAPYDDPEVLCCVVIDEPKSDIYGGNISAPIFREVLSDIQPLVGGPLANDELPPVKPREPEDPQEEEVVQPVLLADLAGLPVASARQRAQGQGFEARLSGSGTVVARTDPAAGEECPLGAVITLFLADPGPDAAEGGLPMPDLRGLSLRDAMILLASIDAAPRVDGSGWVLSQVPSPGDPFSAGQPCFITLGPDSCRAWKEQLEGGERAARISAHGDLLARATR